MASVAPETAYAVTGEVDVAEVGVSAGKVQQGVKGGLGKAVPRQHQGAHPLVQNDVQ